MCLYSPFDLFHLLHCWSADQTSLVNQLKKNRLFFNFTVIMIMLMNIQGKIQHCFNRRAVYIQRHSTMVQCIWYIKSINCQRAHGRLAGIFLKRGVALVWRWAFICGHTIAHNLTKLITSQYTSFDLVPKLNSCTCHQIHDILSVKCWISAQTFLSYDGQGIDILF